MYVFSSGTVLYTSCALTAQEQRIPTGVRFVVKQTQQYSEDYENKRALAEKRYTLGTGKTVYATSTVIGQKHIVPVRKPHKYLRICPL